MPDISRIPMPVGNLQAFESGFKSMDDFFHRVKAHALEQQKIKQLIKQHEDEMELKRSAESRAKQLQPLRELLLKAQANSANSNADWNSRLLGRGQQNVNAGRNVVTTTKNNMGIAPFSSKIPNTPFNKANETTDLTEDMMQGQTPVVPDENQNMGQEIVLRRGDPKRAWMNGFPGIKGIPQIKTAKDNNGNLITTYPNGDVTSQKVGQSVNEVASSKEDAKIVSDLQKSNLGLFDLKNSYDEYQKAIQDDTWKKINSGLATKFGEKGRQLNLSTLKNTGTEDQKRAIAKVESAAKGIVAKSASLFKGPFRISEQALVESYKPQPYDTLEAQETKLEELQKLIDMQQYVDERIPDLVRNKGKSINDAFRQAKEEIKARFSGSSKTEAGKTKDMTYNLSTGRLEP